MKFLPSHFVALDRDGKPLLGRSFNRINATSPAGRLLDEEDWDGIICANVEALAEALRAADVLPLDSTLRVLGQQVDCVDVLFAEVPISEGEPGEGVDLGEPRRLVILEDKLVRNPEAKRQVLAQALDYAQRAQHEWTTEYLCSVKKLARHAAWLRQHASRLDVLLQEGDLLVVIAGDDIDDDLLRLAKRFAGSNDPLSLNELCLVSMALYERGDERLLIPHVVSAVERHQRQLTVRVRVQDANGVPVRAVVERDVEADMSAARGGALPVNPDVESFLTRAKAILDPVLLASGSPYETTEAARKILEYWTTTTDGSRVRFKIHFGGFVRDLWSPIQVGLYVESRSARDQWLERIQAALQEGRLPVGTKPAVAGKLTVSALKEYSWSAPVDLSDALLQDVTSSLVRIESVLGVRDNSRPAAS